MALLSDPPSRLRAWTLAARPRTLWAAITPVLVGSGLAFADDAFRADAFVVTLLAALAIQIGVNFANDAADAARGADRADRIGPVRVVAAGLLPAKTVWWGVAVAFGLAALGGLYLAWIAGWVILVIGAASLLAALGYTSGPAPYGYRALGELFVFAFFGPTATVGSRYVHDGTAPGDAWLLAVPIGFLITAILVANNYRDIDTDAAAGKRTLAVVLGRSGTRALFVTLVSGAFALTGIYAAAGWTPRWTALALVTAPAAIPPIQTLRHATAGPPLIRVLEETARLQAAFGALVALGAALQRL